MGQQPAPNNPKADKRQTSGISDVFGRLERGEPVSVAELRKVVVSLQRMENGDPNIEAIRNLNGKRINLVGWVRSLYRPEKGRADVYISDVDSPQRSVTDEEFFSFDVPDGKGPESVLFHRWALDVGVGLNKYRIVTCVNTEALTSCLKDEATGWLGARISYGSPTISYYVDSNGRKHTVESP